MAHLVIDTARYIGASRHAASAGQALRDATERTVGSLQRTAGMAGWDYAGVQWAEAYDPAVQQVLTACRGLAASCDETSRTLAAAAATYTEAEHRASLGTSVLEDPRHSRPWDDGGSCGRHAPAAGGGNPGFPPAGWDLLAGLSGAIWPNADPGLLRHSATVWRAFAGDLDQLRHGPLGSAGNAADGLVSADLALFAQTISLTVTATGAIAQSAAGLAAACDGYAQAVEQSHAELAHEATMFVAECAALAVAGTVLSFVTMGGSAGIAAVVGAARAAHVAGRVTQILARLAGAAGYGRTVVATLPQLGRLTAALHALRPGMTARRVGGRALAPAVRHITLVRRSEAVARMMPVAALGTRFLDSRVAAALVSGPTSVLRDEAVYRLRRRAFGSWAARGEWDAWAMAAIGKTRWGTKSKAFRSVTWTRTAQGRIATASALVDRTAQGFSPGPPVGTEYRPAPVRIVLPGGSTAPGTAPGITPGTAARRAPAGPSNPTAAPALRGQNSRATPIPARQTVHPGACR